MFFFNKIGDTKQIYTQSHTSTLTQSSSAYVVHGHLANGDPDLSMRCNPRDEAETDPQ